MNSVIHLLARWEPPKPPDENSKEEPMTSPGKSHDENGPNMEPTYKNDKS
ncbi:3777_t:CDS:1, partial [Acaulospora morrowiae]